MSRSPFCCVFGWALFVSILAGTWPVIVLAATGSSRPASLADLPTLHEMMEVLAFGALVSMPMTLPMGLIGGIMAARFSEGRGQTWSRSEWLRQGARWGAVLGALGPVLYFGGMGLVGILSNSSNPGSELDTGVWKVMALMMALGIPTGIVAGLITAAPGHRLVGANRPPSDAPRTC